MPFTPSTPPHELLDALELYPGGQRRKDALSALGRLQAWLTLGGHRTLTPRNPGQYARDVRALYSTRKDGRDAQSLTIEKNLSLIRRTYHALYQRGHLSAAYYLTFSTHLDAPRDRAAHDPHLPPQQLSALRQHGEDPFVSAAAELVLAHGYTLSQLLALRWTHLGSSEAVLARPGGTVQPQPDVKLDAQLHRELLSLRGHPQAQAGPLFPWPDADRARTALRRASRAAGLTYHPWSALRRHAILDALRSGEALPLVAVRFGIHDTGSLRPYLAALGQQAAKTARRRAAGR